MRNVCGHQESDLGIFAGGAEIILRSVFIGLLSYMAHPFLAVVAHRRL